MRDRLVQAIMLVDDLDEARRRMGTLGLVVVAGGRHPGRGTANLIVPFGRHYLELLAVVDAREARSSAQGRPVVAALERRGVGLARWSVEPADIEATANRVGYPIEHRRRQPPDGNTIRWRSVGVDEAWDEPWRCAFMVWDDPTRHPARPAVDHPNGATGIACLDVDVVDEASALAWLGGQVPEGVTLTTGQGSGPVGLSLSTPAGPLPVEW